jgi:hypothetical protein
VRPRGAWHQVLHVVAWAMLLFFLAAMIGSSVINIMNVLQ